MSQNQVPIGTPYPARPEGRLELSPYRNERTKQPMQPMSPKARTLLDFAEARP